MEATTPNLPLWLDTVADATGLSDEHALDAVLTPGALPPNAVMILVVDLVEHAVASIERGLKTKWPEIREALEAFRAQVEGQDMMVALKAHLERPVVAAEVEWFATFSREKLIRAALSPRHYAARAVARGVATRFAELRAADIATGQKERAWRAAFVGERRWQRAHVFRVLCALIEGSPWPDWRLTNRRQMRTGALSDRG